MLRRELSRSLHREYSTNQDHLGLSLFRKGGPLATHYYLVWAYRAKCALVHLLHLQVGSSGGLGGLGIALQQLFHHCDSLSQASVKFKVTDKGLSNGGRSLLLGNCNLQRPSSAHFCFPCKNAHFYQKGKLEPNTGLQVSCYHL